VTSNLKKELLDLSDFVYQRLLNRLDGCTDDEYLWEPVADSWSVHADGDGAFRGDWGLIFDEVPPVTTIAWRLSHIVDCLAGERCALILGLQPESDIFADGLPGTALAGREMLERAQARWRGYVSATDSDKLLEASGPAAGPYSEYSRTAFVLHILDEFIHHGAEIGLMRDLYRAQASQDAFVDACLRADRAALEEVKAKDAGIVRRKIAEQPDLMLHAAATGRWSAIPLIAELGFPVNGTKGRGALHHAAADGRVELVRELIELGADVHAKDSIYDSNPLGWAEYFNRTAAADYLRPLTV
jgi:hypothetical protein